MSRSGKKENRERPEKVLGDAGDPEIKQPEEETSRAVKKSVDSVAPSLGAVDRDPVHARLLHMNRQVFASSFSPPSPPPSPHPSLPPHRFLCSVPLA